MIGIIGLGNMGYPMAINLLKAGYTLKVYSKNMESENVRNIISKGALPASTPKDLAMGCDVVLLSLPSSKDSIDVVLGENGVYEAIKEGGVVIETSTVTPATIWKLAESLSMKNVELLDAPVSGGRAKAESGELTIMVGGKKSTFEKCLPILSAIGKKIYYVGELGSAQTIKLLNSYMAITNFVLSRDVCYVAKQHKIDIKLLHEIISNSTGNNWIWSNWVPLIFQNSEIKSTAKIAIKDLKYAMEVVQEAGADTTMLNYVCKRLETFFSKEKEDLSKFFKDSLAQQAGS